MLPRTQLVLLEQTPRSSLRLLQELDARLRELQRAAAASPLDTELQQRAGRSQRRVGPPDQEHNWRFNGKGWFTRPQWNDGRCPQNSEPTQHNTCISPDDQDRHHYASTDTTDQERQTEHPDRQRWRRRAEIARTPEVENSPLYAKPGNKINWDHPHGPRIYRPYDNEKPRPLPISPEHLPSAFTTRGPTQGWRGIEHQKERDRLVKHYTDHGYDERYVRSALGPREPDRGIAGLSDPDVARLPDRQSVVRAARKKRVKDDRRRAAEYEAYVQQHIDQGGEAPFEGHEDYDDYDYDDYDDHGWGEGPETIGGYPNHPGYPGHPDYPQFDGQPAEREDQPPERWTRHRSWWEPAPPPEPEDAESAFTGPRGRGEPPWPRTGQRPGRHDWSSEMFR